MVFLFFSGFKTNKEKCYIAVIAVKGVKFALYYGMC